MAFSEETVREAWKRAGSKCECKRLIHNHLYNRCNKELVLENRGRETGKGAWEAHHRNSTGGDSLSNCEILCWTCHKTTSNFIFQLKYFFIPKFSILDEKNFKGNFECIFKRLN